MGTSDDSRMAGLLAALRFHAAIGSERVFARIRELRTTLRARLAELPGVELITPAADELGAGLLSFRTPKPALQLQETLARVANIRTRVVGEYDYGWMRLSPHVYTRPAELETTVAAIAAALRG